MNAFWVTVYNWFVIPVFAVGIRIGGLVNGKIRRGLAGRRDLFVRLRRDMHALEQGRRIWFHSSSMGEFEQAKPIIAALKQRHSNVRIIASFFSPSGFDHARNYRFADVTTYIPLDSAANARKFIDLVKPDAAVIVRYDVWPNHIWELARRGIPTFLANATMRADSSRLSFPLRSFHKVLYERLTSILTVSRDDVENFRQFNLNGVTILPVGETRYDQVLQRSVDARAKHLIPDSVTRRKKVIVAGSTWPEDEDVLLPAFKKILQYDPNVLLVLVPHEPTENALEGIERRLAFRTSSIRFSDLIDYDGEQIIIVDSIGILMALYQYADVAFVGGSFRQNVHNVLEPAVYGIPVMYGPRHTNSQEAVELARREGASIVHDQQDMYRMMRSFLREPKLCEAAGKASLELVREHAGATERFFKHLEPAVWLPEPVTHRRGKSGPKKTLT